MVSEVSVSQRMAVNNRSAERGGAEHGLSRKLSAQEVGVHVRECDRELGQFVAAPRELLGSFRPTSSLSIFI
jgi:hypothetical protein